ncbi:hypothetical protein LIER_35189 [Lithospermum erythrorhizon]|uniref:Reverse transcriptase domain-containing protein n=1 Tax=Lithospermum erythrorhizon TaxID=34254 RepID=A0AAV3NL88_LITER
MEEDVRVAVFSMGGMKAPVPDGKVFRKFGYTHISLLPKVQSLELIAQFCPISLCNVVSKVISKCIANQLKQVLPSFISSTQSAFVDDRMITDNVLLAYKVHHVIKKKKVGQYGFFSLKLDMEKAYDRVEWGYLKNVMLTMGFPDKLVSLIMDFITTVSYSVLINGKRCGYFSPSRGLRQGDPLSPYLFILCTEGLIALINLAVARGEWNGIRIGRNGPMVSHLLFADDSIVCSSLD